MLSRTDLSADRVAMSMCVVSHIYTAARPTQAAPDRITRWGSSANPPSISTIHPQQQQDVVLPRTPSNRLARGPSDLV
jgi:hypothetical protein